jgi:hypothetical protein
MVLQPLFDAYGHQFVEFRPYLYRAANRYLRSQLTPDVNDAYVMTGQIALQNGYFPVFQWVGRLYFYRMQMAGPGSDEYSPNPYQGYWELEPEYLSGQTIYIRDPDGKIIQKIYDAGNISRNSQNDVGECCNVSGGKQKSKRNKKKSRRNKMKKIKTKKRFVKK